LHRDFLYGLAQREFKKSLQTIIEKGEWNVGNFKLSV
jgi:hypothetical protein